MSDTENKRVTSVKTIQAVQCVRCGRVHALDSDTFVRVEGNIYIGESGGIIGNNMDEEGRVANSSIFCTGQCFREAIAKCIGTRPEIRLV